MNLNGSTYDRAGLLAHLERNFKIDWNGIHGINHWLRVHWFATQVGMRRGADLLVIELFAYLHDCCRVAERGVRLIGSTVAVLLASGRQCGWLWAGDSRIYLYRDAHLTQLTLDHSHVAELQAQGHLSAQQARHHPSQHLITRAVGAAEQLHLDERRIDVCDGDMFLLCSDGLSNEMDEADISAALACGDCARATDMLVDLALREGGRDNITAVVIRADDPDASDRTLANPAVQR